MLAPALPDDSFLELPWTPFDQTWPSLAQLETNRGTNIPGIEEHTLDTWKSAAWCLPQPTSERYPTSTSTRSLHDQFNDSILTTPVQTECQVDDPAAQVQPTSVATTLIYTRNRRNIPILPALSKSDTGVTPNGHRYLPQIQSHSKTLQRSSDRRRLTSEEKINAREVRAKGGACLTCAYKKLKVVVFDSRTKILVDW